jgi:hypothetical protein
LHPDGIPLLIKDQQGIQNIFQERMRTSKCFAMDGSKMEDKPFVGFASTDIKDGCSRKFIIAKTVSTFMAEALATGKKTRNH